MPECSVSSESARPDPENRHRLAIIRPIGHNPRMTETIPREILDDLYEYPRKRTALAYALWLVLGIFGAHRIYLNRVWTGILMLLTGGGALLWWVVDAFLIKKIVADRFDGIQPQTIGRVLSIFAKGLEC